MLCVQPIALVSWGRTLELSTVAAPDVCDWLESTTSSRNKFDAVSQSRKYNLLLTWSAEQPEELRAKTKVWRLELRGVNYSSFYMSCNKNQQRKFI